MLSISFKGNTPQNRFFKISVIGNNITDKIKFIIPAVQNDVDLTYFNPYIKVQSAGGTYLDKISTGAFMTREIKDDSIEIVWTMTRKSLTCRNINVQLQFEDLEQDDIPVWQSAIMGFEVENTIPADEEISEENPTIIQELEKDVNNAVKAVADKTSIVYVDNLPYTPTTQVKNKKDIFICQERAFILVPINIGKERLKMNSQRNNIEITFENFYENIKKTGGSFIDDRSLTKVYSAIVGNDKPFRVGTANTGGELELMLLSEDRVKKVKITYSHYYTANGGDSDARMVINDHEIILPTAVDYPTYREQYVYEVVPEDGQSFVNYVGIRTFDGEGRIFIHEIEIISEDETNIRYDWKELPIVPVDYDDDIYGN